MRPNQDDGYHDTDEPGEVSLFLAGDVMTGRGVDQVLPHPCDPRLFEDYVKSALGYVTLAEEANGRIPKPVGFEYVWGDALAELDRRRPDARLINLETAVTTSDRPAPKGINYRMNPRNTPVLNAAGIDCCVLANNHVLDWGPEGLVETLGALADAGISHVGAGRDREAAERPAVLSVPGGRVKVMAVGSPTAGVPQRWAATEKQPGVNFLPDLNEAEARRLVDAVRGTRRPGDIVVLSIHWGGNWGYEVPEAQRDFARRLVEDAGVDVVWGHSSHHPKGVEVHRGSLILYGCGDFLNDYEGIGGNELFRSDLVLMYLPTFNTGDGALSALRMVPFRISRFSLHRASDDETVWLCDMLTREGERFGTAAEVDSDNTLVLKWNGGRR